MSLQKNSSRQSLSHHPSMKDSPRPMLPSPRTLLKNRSSLIRISQGLVPSTAIPAGCRISWIIPLSFQISIHLSKSYSLIFILSISAENASPGQSRGTGLFLDTIVSKKSKPSSAVSDNYTQIRNLPSVLLPAEAGKQKSYQAGKPTSW